MFDYTWIIALASIIGTIANIYQKRWCFIIWTITFLNLVYTITIHMIL